jgi:DNA polymerase-3 subunit alpha
VLPPDINLSQADFSVVFGEKEPHDNVHGHVRFGLSAIKGIGRAVIDSIVAERTKNGPFTSIYDLCERVSAKSINKAAIELLIKCGALDSVHGTAHRAAMTAAIDDAMAAGASAAEDARAGQMNFFAAMAEAAPAAIAPKLQRNLPSAAPWSAMDMLKAEKDALGFHVSGHPLDQHQSTLRDFCTAVSTSIGQLNHDTAVVIGGQLTRVRMTFVKNGRSAGEKMAMITLSDSHGSIDGVVFSGVFAKYGAILTDDAIVLLIGRVDRQRGEPQIIVDQVLNISDAAKHLAGRIEIDFADDSAGDPVEAQMQMVAGLLQQAGAARVADGGKSAEVFVNVLADGRRYAMKSGKLRAIADAALLRQLREVVGVDRVRTVSGGAPKPAGNGTNGAKRWNRSQQLVEA